MIFSDAPPAQEPVIVVVGTRADSATDRKSDESATAVELQRTNNVRNSEDSLRYFPSLLVRKRHIGDTQAPLATRTSGVGASARSLIYADGVLLSALIGNNNSFASPRWGMLSPAEIVRVDVLYGPFAAAYPGNSIGAVVNFTTRMPDRFEATATAATNVQAFDQYGTDVRYPAYQVAGTIGDRSGPLAWFLSANHSDSRGQPLAYVTVARPAATATQGTPVTGAFEDRNRTGSPIYVIGAGGLEHHRQDNLKAKLALDLAPSLRLSWTTGLFLNDTSARADSYLHGNAGAVLAGRVNIDGHAATIPDTAFSNQAYRFAERHWMHSVALEEDGGTLRWSLVGSAYLYAKDEQRIPGSASAIANGGKGSIVRMDGTGWRTLDAKADWQAAPGHALSAGAHYDGFALRNRRFDSADWERGGTDALAQLSQGRTRTLAAWAEDRVTVGPAVVLTLGARYEWWKAFDGRNVSARPLLDRQQPSRTAAGLSPKASLRWRADDGPWSLTLSAGRAYRFPTVSELYQAVAVGGDLRSPSPDLKPEQAMSAELALERRLGEGRLRLSLFHERVSDALIAQTAPFPGSTQLVSFVQNVPRTRTQGIELVAEQRNLLPRVDLSGSVTLADPEVASDPTFPAAEGKRLPQVPARRATVVASWRPSEATTFTLAARYASRSYATIDNKDVVAHTYQGFEPYLVADVRAAFRVRDRWRLAVGVENLTDRRYFLFHPFPGRTATAELDWSW